MGGWGEVLAALSVFLLSHALPARPALREALVARMGRGAYLAVYSSVSLLVLIWLIVAVGRAPYVPLWSFQPWQLWLPLIVMPFACLLASLGLGIANPFSLGGRDTGFDPERPGVVGITRHPLLWALALWAAAHALANGDLAHVALFGTFLFFSLLGAWAIDRRRQVRMGLETWRTLARNAPFLPFGRLGRTRLTGWALPSLLMRLLLAVIVFLGLLMAHLPVIGLSPLPLELMHG
ncbi:MAG: NnrU family protein [Kiloniellales bacterium]